MSNLKNRFKNFFLNPKVEMLSGLTVALALVPEAIAFAFIANIVEPLHVVILKIQYESREFSVDDKYGFGLVGIVTYQKFRETHSLRFVSAKVRLFPCEFLHARFTNRVIT